MTEYGKGAGLLTRAYTVKTASAAVQLFNLHVWAFFSPDSASCINIRPGCSPRCACCHKILRRVRGWCVDEAWCGVVRCGVEMSVAY